MPACFPQVSELISPPEFFQAWSSPESDLSAALFLPEFPSDRLELECLPAEFCRLSALPSV